ncbi:DUF1534 domain-containing protein [Pseudomonas caricapapayae]|nr:DUF1534 domain-containing protein [Pseudomonas caricapapayae]
MFRGLHDHAKHGHDACPPVHLSFLTLQHGNALGDALRHGALKRSRSDAERPELHSCAEREER